jgi:hypothetical protein
LYSPPSANCSASQGKIPRRPIDVSSSLCISLVGSGHSIYFICLTPSNHKACYMPILLRSKYHTIPDHLSRSECRSLDNIPVVGNRQLLDSDKGLPLFSQPQCKYHNGSITEMGFFCPCCHPSPFRLFPVFSGPKFLFSCRTQVIFVSTSSAAVDRD